VHEGPAVAVTVTLYEPGADAARLSAAEAVEVRLTLAGTVAVRPLPGLTDAASATEPLKPFVDASDREADPFDPAVRFTFVGFALSEKSAAGGGITACWNAVLVFGDPRPVGPSYPATAVHR
jgi:hypothetical protein